MNANRGHVVLLIALLGLVGLRAQQPPAAAQTVGATRPNVQVIKDLPESQLFPVMNAMADSLGVTCEYCHVRNAPNPNTVVGGWLWDRDDKPTKAVGKRMLKMVRDLNAANFDGRARVTCFTCHQGSLQPSRLPALPPLQSAPSSPTVLPSAPEIMASYQAAVGGEAAARFATTVMTATDDRSENRHGTFEVQLKGADKAKLTLRMPGQPEITQTMEGDTGWVTSPDLRVLSQNDVAALKRATARYSAIKVIDPAAAMQVRGVEPVRNRPAFVLEAIIDSTTTRRLYFDVETRLLVREMTTLETLVVPLQNQIDYEDYRAVDGVKLPFTMVISDNAPYATATRRFTRIAHGVPLDDALFKPPIRK
ncbi:MAG TPA: photosynthetic reaction center cytochrome c subunit family protein [Vicinamibacterales bacterium]|nr:photosynthetic reaction center cytochrome c subunit family protein [Vicinamibacterales bacterium]